MSKMYSATYEEVSREVFNRVCDRIQEDYNLKIYVTVYYNGSSYSGRLTIEGCGGYGTEYKKALQIFNEEYCK